MQNISLTQDGGQQTLVNAIKGTGAGVFNTDLANSKLNVPASQSRKAGSYIAPLTYTMANTPDTNGQVMSS